jgi:sulfur carrier protein ThiS
MTDQDVDFDAELELATLLSSLQVSREPVASEMDGAMSR